jgi:phosphoserine phosphatase
MTSRSATTAADPLPSWNSGPTKEAIVGFVDAVTDTGGSHYVAPPDRVATFDNDGTLWAEQPFYFQLRYALDTSVRLAEERPGWKDDPILDAASRGDTETVLAAGNEGLLKVLAATHSGMTTDEFSASVDQWIKSADHARFGRKHSEMIYQPMLELLEYLRQNDFKVFIVSGGGIEFIRVFAGRVYGIPPENVVGSSLKSAYEVRDGTPVLIKLPELSFYDDKAGKPVAINHHIGRKPIFAAGNSDGDFEMLEYTTTGDNRAFGLIVHHTDGDREWTYDRDSQVGRLDRALDEAAQRGWVLADMKKDWRVVFPFDLD